MFLVEIQDLGLEHADIPTVDITVPLFIDCIYRVSSGVEL